MKKMTVRFIGAAALLAVAAAPALAAPGGAWMDAPTIARWNVPGAALPTAPKGSDQLQRCASSFRKPETTEDRAVSGAGWKLFAPFELFDGTAIVLAAGDADGMCRPLAYQGFVFVGGTYAGTLAPAPMNARTDGALQQPYLFGAATFSAQFQRYTDTDPLCCPSRSTDVEYRVDRRDGKPVVDAVSASTSPNGR
jgi:hypothetical protein